MTATNRGRREAGFSLTELLISMVVTMVVMGALYGFIAQGTNAFRREPEAADRQQNIRIALDLMMRDIANAGAGMPPFTQIFTTGLDLNPDELELITNSGDHDNEPVCDEPGASPQVRFVRRTNQALPPIVIIVMDNGTWTVRNTTGVADDSGSSGNCTAVAHTRLDFNTGLDDTNPKMNVNGSLCGAPPTGKPNGWGIGNASTTGGQCNPRYVNFSEVVRYRIRNDATGIPSLQRASTANVEACGGDVWGSDSCFQTLAQGIDDLQVTYTQPTQPAETVSQAAPLVVTDNYTTLTTRVAVTVSARSRSESVVGATARNVYVLRGSLVSSESPRAALLALSQDPSRLPPNVTPGDPLWR